MEPDTDPDNDLQTIAIENRFPEQYADIESDIFYNWKRYYDPETGRYITSDPVGFRRTTRDIHFSIQAH
jgi:RHS repeat-associated protein